MADNEYPDHPHQRWGFPLPSVMTICGYCGWDKRGEAGEQCQPALVEGRWHNG